MQRLPVRARSLVWWVLVAAAAALAVFPQLALPLVAQAMAVMREPQQAVRIARMLFAACACAGLVMIAFPGAVRAVVVRAIAVVEGTSERRFWIMTAVLAAVLRGLVALVVTYEPTSDALWYHEAAVSLARGEGFAIGGTPTAYRAPGYPFLLSLAYRAFGVDVRWAWLVGVVACAVILLAVHAVARRLHGPGVARLAALFAAIYPTFVVMSGQAMSDLVFVAGVWLALALVLAAPLYAQRASFGGGVVCGLLTLVRPVGAGLFFVLPLVWALRNLDGRRLLRSLVLSAAGFAVVTLPWMWRNLEQLGSFTVGTNAGVNLYIGNHAGATGGYEAPPPKDTAAGGEAGHDAAYRGAALAFISEHPLQALALVPRKFVQLYLMETSAVTALFQGAAGGPDAPKLALHVVSQLAYLALAAAVLARVASWRQFASRPLGAQCSVWLIAGYFTLLALVFHAGDRFRLPITPALLIEAAVAAIAFAQARRRSISPLSSSSEAN
jgi:4-amino-4-deoxy-L-arabinose transferase-like glycosyltransferase